jgi:hypothetical protein
MDPVLSAALVNAQKTVRAALKTSENAFHRYKYASAEEVLIVGREALNDNDLCMVPLKEDFRTIDPIDDKCGGAVAKVECTYLVIHASGAFFQFSTDVPVVPERGKSSGWSRPADKATFGARTEAIGYALRDLLLIPRQDAPDVSGRRDTGRAGPGTDEQQGARKDAQQNPKKSAEQYLADMKALEESGKLDKCLQYARRDIASELLAPIEGEFSRKRCLRIASYTEIADVEKTSAYVDRPELRGEGGEQANAELAAARVRLGATAS